MHVTAVLSIITNTAIGFTSGVIIFYLFKKTEI